MKVSDLFVEHSYYCNDANYFKNGCLSSFECWDDFFEERGTEDQDYNLIFRWDVKEHVNEETEEPNGIFYLCLYYMLQRKGLFQIVHINNIEDRDAPAIAEFLKTRWENLKEIWTPISQ